MARWAEAPRTISRRSAPGPRPACSISRILQADKYEEAMRQAMSRLWAGEPSKTILDEVAAQWDDITEKIGVDKQRAVYQVWAAKPDAYPK